MPWRSIAFATRSARCVNTRFMRRENFVRCLCMVAAEPPAGSRLPYRRRPVTSVFYLFRDAPQRRAALELEPGSPPRATPSSGWTSSPSAGTPSATTSSDRDPRLPARLAGAALKRGLEARRRVRRRLRHRALVAPAAEPRRRRLLDGRHGRHPADAARAGRVRAVAVRVRRDRAARAPRASSAPGAWSGSTRRRSAAASAIVAYSAHEADVLAAWLGEREQTRRSSSCRSGSTSRRSGRRPRRRRRRRLGRRRPAPRLRAAPRRRPGACRRRASSSSRRRDRARSLDGLPGQRLGRDRPAVRRDAPAARARPRRRAARARQQLLGRDDGAPPGDGARQAGRRHADGGDRDGLRARGRRQRAARGARRRRAASGARSPSVLGDDAHARALGVRARATVESELTWDRYVERLESLLLDCSRRTTGWELSHRLRPADARCASSSSAPQDAQGCVSTKSFVHPLPCAEGEFRVRRTPRPRC